MSNVTFHLIPPGQASRPVTVPKENLLDALQGAVQGPIEVVYDDGGQVLLVNEEGNLRGDFGINTLATQKAQHVRGFFQLIVGPAVIIASEDFD